MTPTARAHIQPAVVEVWLRLCRPSCRPAASIRRRRRRRHFRRGIEPEAQPGADADSSTPFADQDAEHADRLKALQSVALMAYAEKLQRALTNQGHSITLAAAITVAKEMRS